VFLCATRRWLHLPTFQAYYQFAGLLLVVLPIVFGVLAYLNKRPGQVRVGVCCGAQTAQQAGCWLNSGTSAAPMATILFGCQPGTQRCHAPVCAPQVVGGDDIY
jgi:hypothetical protein